MENRRYRFREATEGAISNFSPQKRRDPEPGDSAKTERLKILSAHYERYTHQSLDIGIDPYLKISLVEIQ